MATPGEVQVRTVTIPANSTTSSSVYVGDTHLIGIICDGNIGAVGTNADVETSLDDLNWYVTDVYEYNSQSGFQFGVINDKAVLLLRGAALPGIPFIRLKLAAPIGATPSVIKVLCRDL
jgi:hypothetical protein